MSEVHSTCCYCGVGCGVIIDRRDGRITGVRGDPKHPANFGRLCGKGQTLHETVGGHGRALFPEMRLDRSTPRQRVTWDAALDHVADRFAGIIKKHGPDAVAFYVSGQLLTEDYYAFNKLARALVGTNNIDSNSRLCMSSAVAGYKATLGADAPPGCYEDIDHADCILIAGSNTAWAHPVLFRRIEDAKAKNPDLKIIVIDPRRTATAEIADLHLAIQPGSDVALFHGMLNALLRENLANAGYIEAHTQGYHALKTLVREYSPEFVAETCGISSDALLTAARCFGTARAALSLYCMGLNQSAAGADKNAALINLHLATGHIGRPGAGPFSLTGQPNAMGGRETGTMANLLIGHRDIDNAADRAEVAKLWDVPEIPARPGKTAIEMFEALRRGEIKAVWIACTNPAQSLPAQNTVRDALINAELVVLQEAYADTETAPFADVLLPAAGWGEKEGTVTNSERRISRVRAAVDAPGETRPDWRIVCDFAMRLERRLHGHASARFAFNNPQQIFNEYREMTRGRNTDISGLGYATLDAKGPQQWPYAIGVRQGTPRLYENGVFPIAGGRARFAAVPYRPVAENIDARFPVRLNTGRLRDQWHGMTRSGRVARLWAHAPEPAVALNPGDLARRGLRPGDIVRLESRRGALHLIAAADAGVAPGQAFLPMHWGSRYLSGVGINALTLPVIDPKSFQPELKHCAIRLVRAALPWRLIAFGTPRDGEALAQLARVQAWLPRFEFASCALTADAGGVLLRAGAGAAPAAGTLDALHALFELDGEDVLRYADTARGNTRRVRLDGDRVTAVCLTGDGSSESWLREFHAQGLPAAALGAMLLAPTARAPAGAASRGRIICSCHGVGETAIAAALQGAAGDATARLGSAQQQLLCGTQCGSCLPELRKLAAAAVTAA
ncbi:MAG: molybdopterin-dependent oxidoreductase [Burkholderiales bacterium]|nr:molybdopterin-dependent oxidoreductase [Burkholderiales bacterium]